MTKTLYLHIGAGKTGTSAIQAYLLRATDNFLDYGFCYPLSYTTAKYLRRVSLSGNGVELACLLKCKGCAKFTESGFVSQPSLEYWIKNVVLDSTREQILVSSELLQFPDKSLLFRFGSLLADSNVRVRIIYYARTASDYCISAYLQNLQLGFPNDIGGGFPRNLSKFLESRTVPYRYTLGLYEQTFSESSLSVTSFDQAKDCLIASFLTLLGIEHPDSSDAGLQVVNRSLTPSEMLVLERLAENGLEQSLLRRIGTLLITGRIPRLDLSVFSKFPVLSASLDTFIARTTPELEWLNTSYMKNTPISVLNASRYVLVDEPVSIPDMALLEVIRGLLSLIEN